MKMRFVFFGSLVLAAVGVWLAVSPWVIGYPASASYPRWNDLLCGVLVAVFGLWSAARRTPDLPFWPTIRQAVPSIAIVVTGLYLWFADFAAYYFRIGRTDTFYQFCVATSLLILGMAVWASRMGHAQKPSELHQQYEQAALSAIHR